MSLASFKAATDILPLGGPMTYFLSSRLPSVFVVVTLCAVATSAIAQTNEGDDAVEQLLARFQKEREEADWPYGKLVERSDAVVIATFESKRTVQVDFETLGFGDERTTSCVSSKFKIVAAIKNDGKTEEIEIIHLEWKPSVIVLVKHNFMGFQSRMPLPNVVPAVIDGKVTGYATALGGMPHVVTPEYLLFLRRRKDGSYVPTSGQRYAGLSSRMINK